MLEIECAGEKLQLLPEKAVYWPAMQTLIVADLHLGKSAAFRAAGIPVPESTTHADLLRLQNLVFITRARRLIILGDLFHARSGLQREMMEQVERWRQRHPALDVTLIQGNHDQKTGPPPDHWNFRFEAETWRDGPFIFSHKPMESNEGYVLSGHIHPAFVLRDKFGPSLRSPCFCFGKRRAILPAFGSFTGMANIKPAEDERIFIVGECEVLPV